MNIEGKEMEMYQFFLVPIDNSEITEETEFLPRAPVLKYKPRNDLYDKE